MRSGTDHEANDGPPQQMAIRGAGYPQPRRRCGAVILRLFGPRRYRRTSGGDCELFRQRWRHLSCLMNLKRMFIPGVLGLVAGLIRGQAAGESPPPAVPYQRYRMPAAVSIAR